MIYWGEEEGREMMDVERKDGTWDERAYKPWLIWFYLHNHMICRFKAETPHAGEIRPHTLEAPPALIKFVSHVHYCRRYPVPDFGTGITGPALIKFYSHAPFGVLFDCAGFV